jgi:nitroreductase
MDKEIVFKRRSIVCFDKKPVPANIIKDIFEAARWAPSSNNQQPWRFIVGIKGSKTFDFIYNSLSDGNKTWAVNAPILVVSVGEVVSSYNNKTNLYAWHDTALAFSNLIYRATAEDLFLHPMAGFSPEKVVESFKIPSSFQPILVAAIGYKGSCEGLPQTVVDRENRERKRKELNEIVFSETWENPYEF